MGRKIIQSNQVSLKDENGIYVRPENPDKRSAALASSPVVESDLSIDKLLKDGLLAISRAMRIINMQISTGEIPKGCIENLRDCMTMLQQLKKKEDEILEDMSDEDLEKLSKGQK